MKKLRQYGVLLMVYVILAAGGIFLHVKTHPAKKTVPPAGYCIQQDEAGHFFVSRDADGIHYLYNSKLFVSKNERDAVASAWEIKGFEDDRASRAKDNDVEPTGRLQDVRCGE